jgi:hypothetical protein
MKVVDFLCSNGHRHERFLTSDIAGMDVSLCPECGKPAERQVSAPNFKLEGTTGSFPGAHMQWEKKRAQKMAVQARKERDHGDSGW